MTFELTFGKILAVIGAIDLAVFMGVGSELIFFLQKPLLFKKIMRSFLKNLQLIDFFLVNFFIV